MDFRQLEAFVTVARLNSFSKAADELYLTQPAVSNQLLSLEKELNIVLLDRSSRGLNLTSGGKIFLPWAREILDLKNKALYSVQQHKGEIHGNLEIVASSLPSIYLLPGFLKDFLASYPNVRYRLYTYDSYDVIDKILAGYFNFGFVGSMIKNKALEYMPFYNDELVIIRQYEPAKIYEKELDFKDIENENWILREKGSGTRKAFEDIIAANGMDYSSLNILCTLESNESIKQWVRIGLGLSVMSTAAISDELVNKQLVAQRLKNFALKRPIYFVYHKNRTLSPLVESFKQYVLRRKDDNHESTAGK